jgi:hypothetical protein
LLSAGVERHEAERRCTCKRARDAEKETLLINARASLSPRSSSSRRERRERERAWNVEIERIETKYSHFSFLRLRAKKKKLFPWFFAAAKRAQSFLGRRRHAPRPRVVLLLGCGHPRGSVWTSRGADNDDDDDEHSANDGVDVFVRGVLLLFSFQSVAICALGIEGRMSSLD